MIGTVALNDGVLSYSDTGEGSPVVLLHAGLMDQRMWEPQITALSKTNRLIAYDARGHGQSSTPSGTVAHHRDLLALLDALQLETSILMGCSLGARTAIDLALVRPDRVAAVVLISPGISGMTFHDPYFLARVDEAMAAVKAQDLQGVVEANLRCLVDGPRRLPDQTPPLVRQLCAQMMTDTLIRHEGSGLAWDDDIRAIDHLPSLAIPTTVVTGDIDISDSHDMAARLGAQVSDVRTATIPGAGHLLNLEQPESLQEILDRVSALRP